MSVAFDARRDAAFVGVTTVDPSHAVDVERLEAWLTERVAGFKGPLKVAQFKGGQSNPTYKLITPDKAFVLRRKPPGDLLPSAHAVEREHRVLSALGATDFPVPRTHALCEDLSVIGSPFYVMEMLEGRVLWDLTLPDLAPEGRRAVYEAQIRTLAKLHSIDVEAVGLADFGRPGDYFERQVTRWTRQYRAAETAVVPDMDRLIAWLPTRLPPKGRTTVVHGDYRLDNMVLHSTRPEVLGVLDWELSTIGDPLADLAWFLMAWVLPPGERAGFRGQDPAALGIPSLDEMVAQYCALTGRTAAPDLDWLLAFTMFRLAAICQGIVGRVRSGVARSPHALHAEARVPVLAAMASRYTARAGA